MKWEPVEVRFWRYVRIDPASGCWDWASRLCPQGYPYLWGGVRDNPTMIKAHRYSYELLVGPIPEGLELDHLCRNRGCVNPAHLEAVTHRENMRRSRKARQTHCLHGHPFSGENLISRPNGQRGCRECAREGKRRFLARQRVAKVAS